MIEGDGDSDRLVDPDVAPARPSWRADTHALAYVGADGRARVAAYPSLATRPASSAGRRIAALAFAPQGDRLALGASGDTPAVSADGSRWVAVWGRGTRLSALAWESPDALLVAGSEPGSGRTGRLWRLPATAAGLSGKPSASAYGVRAQAVASPGPERTVIAVRVGREVQVWEIAALVTDRDVPLRRRRILLRAPAGAPTGIVLSVR